MQRRDFVKGIAAASAAATAAATALGQQKAPPQAQTALPATGTVPQGTEAVAPNAASSPGATARLQQMAQFHTPNIPVTVPDLVAVTEVRYFTPARYATLVRLCDVLMPAGDSYPSAVQAGVPEFLDFMIGGSPAERQAMYNNGLDRLNADSMKECHTSFAKTDAKGADMVIRPYLKAWINDHPPREAHERFIALSHRDIRTATTNSPLWAEAAQAAGERTPGVGLYVAQLDPGIDTWVSHGMEKTAAPVNRHAHA